MTLIDRLSRLTLGKAEKLLGPNGKKHLIEGSKIEVDIAEQVQFGRDFFRLNLPDAKVSIVDDEKSMNSIRIFCSECDGICYHAGAAISTILDQKSNLGLAKTPEAFEYAELTDEELVKREIARRTDRANIERMEIEPLDQEKPWSDYLVTSRETGKTYRVAIRGLESGLSYCSCPDYRKNTLGSCKHIIRVISYIKSKFNAKMLKTAFVPDRLALYVQYGDEVELRIEVPDNIDELARNIFNPYFDKPIDNVAALLKSIASYMQAGGDLLVYPDAEELLHRRLHEHKTRLLVDEIHADPSTHPLRNSLLKVPLLPYQLDGIAFVAGKGRAVIADEMGLGKTIQAIGTAELLAHESNIKKVLIVCPASLKSQWVIEIDRFCDRVSQIVAGSASDRRKQYSNDTFFTICNYEQVLRDLEYIEQVPWEFIILDEGQRIKNWEAKTSQVIKSLRSRFALVLTGTPLENRLEELFSVVEFIDERQLGPAFKFYHKFKITSDKGAASGYRNLSELRGKLKPVLLRRTRSSVQLQLPPRSTEVIRITPSQEQLDINTAQLQIVNQIINKDYLTEMDLLRLQKALLLARLAADSTYLIDKKEPSFSTKLEYIAELIPRITEEKDRKTIIFSEWTTMLDCIEPLIKKAGAHFVRLDGKVPQKQRQAIVSQFQKTESCRFFLTTNAGSTGLNLQAANTIINVDLPWNPAILEQRIARAHRMGQTRPVQIYLLVTTDTIEEKMLSTLAAKHDLAMAALNPDSDVNTVEMRTGIEDLKKRLEILLGCKQESPVDLSMQQRERIKAQALAKQKNIEEASGTLLGAALGLLSQLMPEIPIDKQSAAASVQKQIVKNLLDSIDKDESGRMILKIAISDEKALESVGKALAGLAISSGMNN